MDIKELFPSMDEEDIKKLKNNDVAYLFIGTHAGSNCELASFGQTLDGTDARRLLMHFEKMKLVIEDILQIIKTNLKKIEEEEPCH